LRHRRLVAPDKGVKNKWVCQMDQSFDPASEKGENFFDSIHCFFKKSKPTNETPTTERDVDA